MKGNTGFFSKANGLLKKLTGMSANKNGSILSLVVILGAALFIVTAGLLMVVGNTTQVTKSVDNSENAYLTARSGITMLTDAGKDSSFAQKIIDSMGKSDPIKMDFGNQGKCEAYVTDMGESTEGSIIYKIAKVECTGICEDNSFKLTRFLKFKQTGTAKTSELKTCAYLHYGDGDMYINGGIDGNAIIIGNGHITNKNSSAQYPMHEVVCSNELVLTNSGCQYDLIAAGKYLYLTGATVKSEVYVGSDVLGSDGKFTDVLNDNIYAYLAISTTGSAVRCEGVTIFGNNANINTGNKLNDTSAKDPSQLAVVSGGDLYLGYTLDESKADTYKSGDSYMNPASTVDTKLGLNIAPDGSGDNAGGNFYGTIVSGGDVFIGNSAHYYGDIIAKGDVTISKNCKIDGQIYAGGKVTIESGADTSADAMFPTAENRVINAGGDIVFNSPNINSSNVKANANQSPVEKIGNYFNGSDYVGAADYFKSQYESAPKPITNIPSKLYSLTPTLQSDRRIVEDKWTCNDWNCGVKVRDFNEKCDQRVDWHPDCNPTPENIAAGYWSEDGTVHYEHMGRFVHPTPHLKSYDPPVYKEEVIIADQIHITEDTYLQGDFNFGSDYHTFSGIYIDCYDETTGKGKNIDILLDGNINVTKFGGIYINDNNGQNRVRLFLKEGATINFNDCYGIGVNVIADGHEDIDMSSLPYTHTISDDIDMVKVPQFYVFAEEGKDNIDINLGPYGNLPGYVLTPYLNITTVGNAHCFRGGSLIGMNADDHTQVNWTNYPYFNGMLMCNSMNFSGGACTHIRYDTRLDDVPDSSDPSVMVKTATKKKFNQALSDDNVMVFDNSGGTVDSSGGSVTYKYVCTGSY